jgi:hypothetical protein
MTRTKSTVRALALVGLVLSGCHGAPKDRPATFPVKGQVLFDGKPAAGARVRLHATTGGAALAKLCPHAEVAGDGSFVLTTFRTGDGAPAGSYALTLAWPAPPPPGREEGADRFKGRYADPRKPLRQVEILAGDNILEPVVLK